MKLPWLLENLHSTLWLSVPSVGTHGSFMAMISLTPCPWCCWPSTALCVTTATETWTTSLRGRAQDWQHSSVQTEDSGTFTAQPWQYRFSATEWPNGHYVHTIDGHKEEPSQYHYWLLYRVPELPDPAAPPSNSLITPVCVDGLFVEEGDHYLFWYKKL